MVGAAADQRRAGRDAFRQLTTQWITATPRLAHDNSWALRAVTFQRPTRLSIHTAAFTTSHALSYTPGESLTLGGTALSVQDPGEADTGVLGVTLDRSHGRFKIIM